MKRFVICMPSRKENAIKELDKFYKGEYEIFNAIINIKGSVGISESFKSIIRNNYDEPCIQIFEDDVKFTSEKSREVFEANMPEDFDIYLGGCYTFDEIERTDKLIRVSDFASLHCVVIRKSAYDYFLNHDYSIDNIDRYVGQFCKDLKVYICNPMIAVQYNGHSFNRGRVVNYDYKLEGKPILL